MQLLAPPQLKALEPKLSGVPAQALFLPNEGAVDAARATALFIQAAHEAGAAIRLGSAVRAFTTSQSRITGIVTTTGQLMGDMVVLAAGTGTASLGHLLGLA